MDNPEGQHHNSQKAVAYESYCWKIIITAHFLKKILKSNQLHEDPTHAFPSAHMTYKLLPPDAYQERNALATTSQGPGPQF